MGRSVMRVSCALATGAATCASLGIIPARAATLSGWQITKTFPVGSSLYSVAGVGKNDAWLAGATAGNRLLVQHFNGRRWISEPAPAGITSSDPPGNAVVAGSSTAVWAFADLGNSTDNGVALRWTGGGWRTYQFGAYAATNAAAVFSRTDAWAFGERFGTSESPLVLRFNGSSWRSVGSPLVPADASAVSANDIWTVGQTTKSLGSPQQVFAAAQWSDGRWHVHSFPRLQLPTGTTLTHPYVLARGTHSVWVDFALSNGDGLYPGRVLLHYNGVGWSRVAVPYRSTFMLANLAPDGRGGIWIAAAANSGLTWYMYHLLHGTWSRALMPSVSGDTTQVTSVALRPGTLTVWAAGDMVPVGGGSPQGVLLRHRG